MNAPVTVLLVDDEPAAREGMRRLLARHAEFALVGECRDGHEAVEAIRARRPDVVVLDIQMPELDGWGVIAEIGAREMPFVIFATAFDQHAVRAFEVSALAYLVKPFSDEQFADALRRAERAVRQATLEERADSLSALLDRVLDQLQSARNGNPPQTGGATSPRDPISRLLVRAGDRSVLVDVNDIDWFEAADDYVRVHAGTHSHLMRGTLAALEQQLDARRFFRLHRSAIVNVGRIHELRRSTHGDHVAVLRSGVRLPLPRGRREQLAALLGQDF